MKIEDIQNMWKTDCHWDIGELNSEAQNISILHSKYIDIMTDENLRLMKYQAQYKKLKLQKEQYYRNELDIEDLKQLGWKPLQIKILRNDVPSYVEADDDIINLSLKIGVQKQKIELLDSIIRRINSRGFDLKTALDWEKYRSGAI